MFVVETESGQELLGWAGRVEEEVLGKGGSRNWSSNEVQEPHRGTEGAGSWSGEHRHPRLKDFGACVVLGVACTTVGSHVSALSKAGGG